MNFNLEYIEKLVKMVSDSELTELALEEKDSAIIIRKEKEVVQAQTIVPQAIAFGQETIRTRVLFACRDESQRIFSYCPLSKGIKANAASAGQEQSSRFGIHKRLCRPITPHP